MPDASTRSAPPPPPVHHHQPPPTPPSSFSEFSLVPDASKSTLVLVALGAILADVALHGRVASLAGSLSVVVAAFVVISAPERRTVRAAAPAGLAILLASNLVIRASDWVTAPTLAACGALLWIAALDRLTSARPARLGETLAVLTGSARRSVRHVAGPAMTWIGPPGIRRTALVRGGATAAAVVVILTLLLANADAVVGQLLARGIETSMWTHVALSILMALVLSTLAVTSRRRLEPAPAARESTARPIEAAMGMGAVAMVLSVWVTIQATIALGGADHLLETASLTRADYAREGFFELVVVVMVVLTMQALFGRMLGSGRRFLAGTSNTLVGALTVMLVAITFSRLALYVDAYGLTVLRLAVAWFLGWLGLLVVTVSLWSAGLAADRRWMPAATIVSAALMIGAFGWSNPEATVATTNLSRENARVELDTDYLRTLGPDAAPVLRTNGIASDVACRPDRFGILGWNSGWATACD